MTSNRLKSLSAALIIGAVLAGAVSARAGVIIDTMSGGYDTTSGSDVAVFFNPASQGNPYSFAYAADQFNTGAHTALTDIALALSGHSNLDIILSVVADNNGQPGAQIFSQDIGVISGNEIVTLSNLSIAVTENTTYWLKLTASLATVGDDIWDYVTYPYASFDGAIGGGTSWRTGQPSNAFAISGDDADVPEPASLALMGAGVAGLSFLRRRKQA